MALTKNQVITAVSAMADAATKGAEDREEWHDLAFEKVDEWWETNIGTGMINELDDYPVDAQDLEFLQEAVLIMQVADEQDWGIADDEGLWEGLKPWQAVLSQAFFTLEQAVGQQEPDWDDEEDEE